MLTTTTLAYLLPLSLLWLLYVHRRWRLERSHRSLKARAIEDGLTDPVSLHPRVDATACIGCRSCLNACPEQAENNVLGFIDGKAELVNGADCIGHGACRAACPVDAIELVFGTARRGVELPQVDVNFETNVSGVFIGGELGGMGLIKNAMEQGRQAVEAVAERAIAARAIATRATAARARQRGDESPLDLLIVGAGPAGFSASLTALQRGLEFVTVEQDARGGAISHYPRGKITMLHARKLPMLRGFKHAVASKEQLLDLFEKVERQAGLSIHYGERMDDISRDGDAFVVTTSRSSYRCRAVLLAMGRRGTPRMLGVPGEHRSKVVYRLVDPDQYRAKRVLVVGGGDSALEAAVSLAASGSSVVLAHRSEAFNRAKARNRERLRELVSSGRIEVMLHARVSEIGDEHVVLNHEGSSRRIENDAVIICAGGVAPMPLLRKVGIEFETKYGAA